MNATLHTQEFSVVAVDGTHVRLRKSWTSSDDQPIGSPTYTAIGTTYGRSIEVLSDERFRIDGKVFERVPSNSDRGNARLRN